MKKIQYKISYNCFQCTTTKNVSLKAHRLQIWGGYFQGFPIMIHTIKLEINGPLTLSICMCFCNLFSNEVTNTHANAQC